MPKLLRFETLEQGRRVLPTLVDADSIDTGSTADAISIDGVLCEVDSDTLRRFQTVASRMLNETLPPRHFKDCNHFVMAMCGLWMPTHELSDNRYNLDYICHESDSSDMLGPVMMGIPNDSRCVGFGDVAYVYNHTVYMVDTSLGKMCLHKIGVKNSFVASTVGSALTAYGNEVSHTIRELGATCNTQEIFRWRRSDVKPT